MLKKIAIAVVLTFLVIVMSLVCVEMTYRIHLFGLDALSYEKMNSLRNIVQSDYVRVSQYPRVLYELKPNLRTYFKLKRFETNSQGLRDREYKLEKGEGVTRIAVVGSSHSMGSGIVNDEMYHSVMEERLNGVGKGVHYEVINFSVGGYNYDSILATLRYRAVSYKPDVVMIPLTQYTRRYFFKIEQYDEPYKVPDNEDAFFIPYAKRRLFPFKHSEFVAEVNEKEQEVRTREIFQEIEELSKEHNFKVVVLGLNRNPSKQPFDLEKELSGSLEFYFIDTAPYFVNYDSSELRITKLDNHPNALANSIYANALYEGLNEFNLLNIQEVR